MALSVPVHVASSQHTKWCHDREQADRATHAVSTGELRTAKHLLVPYGPYQSDLLGRLQGCEHSRPGHRECLGLPLLGYCCSLLAEHSELSALQD